jgi:hypothetical protein
MMSKKCLKHVEAINRNKLKESSPSYWPYYTEPDALNNEFWRNGFVRNVGNF